MEFKKPIEMKTRKDVYGFIKDSGLDGKLYLKQLENYNHGVLGQTNKYTPIFVVLESVLIPTGMSSWYNCYIPYRTVMKGRKLVSKVKLSLRKYQLLANHNGSSDPKWIRRQNYNINHLREARAIYQLLITYFPQVLSPED